MALSPNDAILITGASQGIGREIALFLASSTTHPLILIARNTEGLAETKERCIEAGATQVDCFSCDLTSEDEIKTITGSPIMENVAMLVNNAGFYVEESVLESKPDTFRSQLEVNLMSAIMLTQSMIPILENKKQASIIFTGSITALGGQARCGAYSVSKHALRGYVQSLREALKSTQISVTSLILGQTWSPSWDGSTVDPERLILPEDVGRVVALLTTLSSQTCIEELVIRPQQGDL